MAGITHRTKVRRGRGNGSWVAVYTAYCVKACGWAGHPQTSRAAAKREGHGHEIYMAGIEDEEGN